MLAVHRAAARAVLGEAVSPPRRQVHAISKRAFHAVSAGDRAIINDHAPDVDLPDPFWPGSRVRAKIQHMEAGYTQVGTVLTDQRPEGTEIDGVIVVGRFKGVPYDGVQLSYDAGRRNLYLTPEGALRLAFLLAAAVERDIDIR